MAIIHKPVLSTIRIFKNNINDNEEACGVVHNYGVIDNYNTIDNKWDIENSELGIINNYNKIILYENSYSKRRQN